MSSMGWMRVVVSARSILAAANAASQIGVQYRWSMVWVSLVVREWVEWAEHCGGVQDKIVIIVDELKEMYSPAVALYISLCIVPKRHLLGAASRVHHHRLIMR